jgi:acetyl esterase/lipase
MKLEQIILAGDSAGGHLAVSVTMLATLRGFRKPDGLIIHYPVFSVNPKFYPSSLLSLDEELLNHTFLKFVLASLTRNGGNPDESPLLSPMTACDGLLKRLPKMTIFAAECDVLRD